MTSSRSHLWTLASACRRRVPAWWNWKAALCSSLLRATIFALTNLPAGIGAAAAAALVELAYRGVAAGGYGALTQACSRARPAWLGTIAALVLLPLAGHGVEWVVHHAAGTPRLAASIGASMGVSVLSTAFTLFVMRRGAMVVGAGSASLRDDVRRMPRLLGAFLLAPLRGLAR